jgi:hypothetical protein
MLPLFLIIALLLVLGHATRLLLKILDEQKRGLNWEGSTTGILNPNELEQKKEPEVSHRRRTAKFAETKLIV